MWSIIGLSIAAAIIYAAVSRETIAQLDLSAARVITVSYLDLAGAPAHLRYLIRRLRHRGPQAVLIAGLWGQGADVLTSYRFGTGAAEHLFCAKCGVKSFYQPRSHPEAWSVNSHCLDAPVKLAIAAFDGRNWEKAKAALDGH